MQMRKNSYNTCTANVNIVDHLRGENGAWHKFCVIAATEVKGTYVNIHCKTCANPKRVLRTSR